MPTSSEEIRALQNEVVDRLAKLRNRDTETIRKLRREFSLRIKDRSAQFVVTLALKLAAHQTVPRFFAYELIQHHARALASLTAKSLEALASGNESWEKVDAFACYLSGPAWRERQVSDAVVKRWAHSADRWWRRTAVVSTVALNSKARGGNGDAARTLLICEVLRADRDDMVVKAVSWALRELSKRDPDAVRKFLRRNQGVLAPRVAREVNNKLQTGLKNPRRQRT